MGFENYHPAINLIYFLAVVAGGILFQQPIFLLISFLAAFSYSIKRNGIRSLVFNLCLLPLVIAFAFFYSGYNHFGVTVLRQNFIDNSITLESFLYGLTLGTQVWIFAMWMSCVHSVFTADKVVYLFGRVSPKASLFLSIVLRMIPRLKAQGKKIATARQALGRGFHQGNFFRRIRNGFAILSILITWLLESFSTISDSMRSRGYSLKGRTAFSIYRFDNRDRSFVVGLFSCLTLVLMGVLLNQTTMVFDPRIILNPITPLSWVFYLGYLVLCLLPMALEILGQWSFDRKRACV